MLRTKHYLKNIVFLSYCLSLLDSTRQCQEDKVSSTLCSDVIIGRSSLSELTEDTRQKTQRGRPPRQPEPPDRADV